MERKHITAFLSEQLIQDRLTGNGKYWAREVSLDWGTKDVRRVDFMEFCPTGVLSVSEIEKGIFVSYEVKSCMADYKSGFGQNFVTEKNYLVMPMELTKQGRKLPCHVCGKKAEIMFREGLFVIICSDEYCNCLCVAEPVRELAIRKWNERPEILTEREMDKLEVR